MRKSYDARNQRLRVGLALLALVLAGYVADAVFPTWDFSCSRRQLGNDFFAGPATVHELVENPGARVMRPTVPLGCVVKPHNKARAVYEWFTRERVKPR